MISSTQTATQFYQRKQRILSASVGEEIVMMSVERGLYYNLNGAGRHIWQLLETPRSLDQIVTALAEIYDAPEEKIRVEACAFLTRLESEGLLEMTNQP